MKVPVLVPKIFNFPFTYDSGSIQNLKIGDLVIVPFGKSSEIGVIWDKIQPSLKEFKIKKIEKRIDNFKINKSLVDFINWFSTSPSVSLLLKLALTLLIMDMQKRYYKGGLVYFGQYEKLFHLSSCY